MQAVASYSFFDTRLLVRNLLNDLLEQMCSLARGLWWSQLASTHTDTWEMDYLLRKMDRKDPTSTLSQEGDVGYSMGGTLIGEECPVVEVTLSTHTNCTYNILAWTGQDEPEQMFVDPVT